KETERIILSGCRSSMSPQKMEILTKKRSSSANKKKNLPKKAINILMLDTPQVHSHIGLLHNFENRTGISVNVTIQPHHSLYETILKNHCSETMSAYDVIMYDIPWMTSLASEN